MPRVIIDTESGEVLQKLNQGDRVLRKESSEYLSGLETIPKHETFSKLYHAIFPALLESNLTASEFIIFMHLATNLRYKSNVAKYSNGKLITRDNIRRDLQISEPTVKRAIRGLITHGLLVEVSCKEGKVFVVNPYVVMVGDKVNKSMFDLFRSTKWARW